MGYYRATVLTCTNPDIIASGSTFFNEWKHAFWKIENGETYYVCRKEYFNDAVIILSKEHPSEIFTGKTWIDSDFSDCFCYTLVIKNGEYFVIDYEPYYQYMFPDIEDVEYNRLSTRFKEHIDKYIKRLDIVLEEQESGKEYDILNDKKDDEGFISHYTITWENDQHLFTATKRYTSEIIVSYEKKTH